MLGEEGLYWCLMGICSCPSGLGCCFPWHAVKAGHGGTMQIGKHCSVSWGKTMLWLVCCLNVIVGRIPGSWRTRDICLLWLWGWREVYGKLLRDLCSDSPALPSERKKGASHMGDGCVFGEGDGGPFVALPLDPFVEAPCPLLWKGRIDCL